LVAIIAPGDRGRDPARLSLLAALLLIYALGYSATGWTLGRSILGRPTAWVVTAFLAGWAILRVIALVLILGGLTWFAAVVFGLGALAVAIWRPVAPAKPPPQRRLTLAAGPCVSGAVALWRPRHAEGSTLVLDQIVTANSAEVTATRRFAGSSAASS
jgi:hypothetical protein